MLRFKEAWPRRECHNPSEDVIEWDMRNKYVGRWRWISSKWQLILQPVLRILSVQGSYSKQLEGEKTKWSPKSQSVPIEIRLNISLRIRKVSGLERSRIDMVHIWLTCISGNIFKIKDSEVRYYVAWMR